MDGPSALRVAASADPPELILLDVMMPGMDGFEVCRRLKDDAATRDIPVIFVTTKNEVEDETFGFKLGAVDYITKPISPSIVLARVKAQVELRRIREALAQQNEVLEARVRERTEELALTQEATMVSLASLAETRDNETGRHIIRTQSYVRILAERLASTAKFSRMLDPATLDLIVKSTPLHDIGKVGIPDAILLKPARLTEAEFEIMKTHTVLGRDALLRAENLFRRKTRSSFFRFARDIAYCHHEKWDGTGYPEARTGDNIPLPARLMALADVYDALVTPRVYKQAQGHAEATSILSRERGKQFDPEVLDAFLELEGRFQNIALSFADGPAAT